MAATCLQRAAKMPRVYLPSLPPKERCSKEAGLNSRLTLALALRVSNYETLPLLIPSHTINLPS
jgi:hypothetical protein